MHKTLLATVAMLALASPAMAFSGNADPRPRMPSGNCEIRDNDPPTNIRSRPNALDYRETLERPHHHRHGSNARSRDRTAPMAMCR